MNEPPFSPNKLAERWDCSPQYVYRLVREGKLPHFKLGDKLVRIPADAVGAKTRAEFTASLPKVRKPKPSLASLIRPFLAIAPEATGRVYFIRCKNFVKIGFTAGSPEDRRRDLQVGNPFKLEIMGSFRANQATETTVHTLLEKHCGLGEWFRLTPAIQEMIAELCV